MDIKTQRFLDLEAEAEAFSWRVKSFLMDASNLRVGTCRSNARFFFSSIGDSRL
jgi:hypothetical protein